MNSCNFHKKSRFINKARITFLFYIFLFYKNSVLRMFKVPVYIVRCSHTYILAMKGPLCIYTRRDTKMKIFTSPCIECVHSKWNTVCSSAILLFLVIRSFNYFYPVCVPSWHLILTSLVISAYASFDQNEGRC